MTLSGIQALGDGYGFYLNKTGFPLKSVAGMTKNGVLQEARYKIYKEYVYETITWVDNNYAGSNPGLGLCPVRDPYRPF
jgi:hypothetical protein